MLSLAAGMILLFLPSIGIAADTNSCESQLIDKSGPQSQCQKWERESKSVLETFADGTILPNPARMRGARLPADVARHANVREIPARLRTNFDRLKESMIQQVTGGSAESSWNDHQKFLVARLRGVNLKIKTKCSPAVDAEYDHIMNQVMVCPLTTAMPFESILPLLAHELGHLADPCNYVVPRRPTARSNPASIRSCLASARLSPTAQERRALSHPAAVEWVADTRVRPHFAALERCGLVTPVTGPTPHLYQGTPYLPLVSCVAEKNAAGTGDDPSLRHNDSISAATPLDTHSNTCHPTRHRHKECTADAIGAALTQFHLRRNPEEFPAERRKLLTYYFASVHCDENNPMPSAKYPPTARRLIEFLQIPEVQVAASCRLTTAPDCRIPSQLASPPNAGSSPQTDARR